ncbi:hypothetical protein [Parahaliea mediterranea]|uniref:hypothetical protein n=1 Tax=Parahaliea mediterranea TaxID=651086 RepID=UPI000E2E7919|nr:hypothetical protein [Parahaliea mediterranea]
MKYVIGSIIGLLAGLPQGLGPIKNFFQVDVLPESTVLTIVLFGLLGGIAMGISLLFGNAEPFGKLSKSVENYFDLYCFMMIGTLSIGIPIIVRVGLENVYSSSLFNGLFFSFVGLGLLVAGVVKWLQRPST